MAKVQNEAEYKIAVMKKNFFNIQATRAWKNNNEALYDEYMGKVEDIAAAIEEYEYRETAKPTW